MFEPNHQQLHDVAADHLDRRVLPLLADETAKAETEALARVLRRTRLGEVLGRAASAPLALAGVATRDALSAYAAQTTDAMAPAPIASGGITAESLTAHLRARPGEPNARAANVVAVTGGFSKQTVFFDKQHPGGLAERLVLRRDLPDSPVETSVRDEFPALCDLHAAGLAVPEPLWLDDGSDHVPGPFLVSRRVEGGPIGDVAAGASKDLGFDPTDLLANTLAQIHSLPLSAMTRSGLCDATWDVDTVNGQIDYWQARYRDHAPGPVPVLVAALGWLRDNADRGAQDPVVVHGDFGVYNLLVDEGRLVGIVDWELVHVGSPAWDLAYVRDHLRKLGSYERFLAAYEAAGRTVPHAEAIDYFQIFTFVRTITMCLVVLAAFDRGTLERIPLVDVCQTIFPLHLAGLCDEFARVSQGLPATTTSGGGR